MITEGFKIVHANSGLLKNWEGRENIIVSWTELVFKYLKLAEGETCRHYWLLAFRWSIDRTVAIVWLIVNPVVLPIIILVESK